MKYTFVLFVAAFYSLFVNPSKAQTAAVDNKLSKTITSHPIPKGPSVLGVFEGRPPCRGIATAENCNGCRLCEVKMRPYLLSESGHF